MVHIGGWRIRGWRRRDVLFDVVPAAVLLVVGELEIPFRLTFPVGSGSGATAVVPIVVCCCALLVRRRLPLVALGSILTVAIVPSLLLPMRLGYWGEFLPMLIATYSTGRHLPRRLAIVGLGMALGGFTCLAVIFAQLRAPGDFLFDAALIIALWALGLFSASWARQRERSLRAELDRARAEERGVQAERARIARELHDVIAHTITVIVVQAGAARLAADGDPAGARKALGEIETLGRGSLAELRLLLAVLRQDDVTDGGTEPQPTLATLHDLCDRMRGLGLPVRLDDQGCGAALPLGLQLTAYRIVQESLTNVIKHAGSAPTRVRLDRLGPDADFVVEVANEAPVDHGVLGIPGARHGLEGLAERVRALDGRFSCGARPDGGFLVRAELPVPTGLA